jgi:hypothetical protein
VVGSERPRSATGGGEKGLRLTGRLKQLFQKTPVEQEVIVLSEREMGELLEQLGAPGQTYYGMQDQKALLQQLAPRLAPSQRKQILAYATRDDFSAPMETMMHTVGPMLGAMTDEEMDALHARVFAPRLPDLAAAEHGFPDRRLRTDAKAGASIGVLLSTVDLMSPPKPRVRQLAQWACEDDCNALSTIIVTGPPTIRSAGIYRPTIDRFAAMLLPAEREAIFKRAVPRLADTPSAAQRMVEVSADLSPKARKLLQAQLDATQGGNTPPSRGWPGR